MSLTEGRKIIADSFEMKTYSPKAQGEWKKYIETYRKSCVK
jgi:hypothetical protein